MKRTGRALAAMALVSALALSACGRAGEGGTDGGTDGDGPTQVTLWTHSAGNPAELEVYNQIMADFNESQDDYEVVSESFPQGAYNDAIVAAATSGDLPCLLDMDGPIVPNWAWAGYIQPLGISSEITDSLLPTAVGMWDDEVYSAGYWDAALAIFARKSVLEANGIRVATVDQPWTQEEFDSALTTLKAAGYDTPLDIGAEDAGEWWPYAYSPMLQSFGGDLIDRTDFKSADGVLNGPEAVAWATWFRSLVTNEWVAAKSGADSTKDFVNGQSAILYNGSWSAKDARAAFGDDLVVLPPPDLGHGPKIGGGSWQWAVSSSCSAPEGAMEYMKFAAQDKYVASVAEATRTIPATDAAANQVEAFKPGGEDDIFRQFAKEFAVVRPETPGYPFIATEFAKTAQDIINGADPQQALDQAVLNIDANQQSNNYFE